MLSTASQRGDSHHEEILRYLPSGLGEQAVTTGTRKYNCCVAIRVSRQASLEKLLGNVSDVS